MGFERVVVLQGKGSTGKTSTLNCLVEKLESEGKKLQEILIREEDRNVILDYHNKRIGVTTLGDDVSSLKRAFCWMEECGGCDLYVCASRTSGETCKYIREQFAKGVVLWVGRSYVCAEKGAPLYLQDLWAMANEAQTLELVKVIRNMIESDL